MYKGSISRDREEHFVLDECHRGDGREGHDHDARPQRQCHDIAIGRGEGHGLLQVPLGVGQLRLGLRDLRQYLRHLVLDAGGNQELTRILDQLQPRVDRLVRRLYVTDGSAARQAGLRVWRVGEGD